jgi:predicted site-specific integrase-resolvase
MQSGNACYHLMHNLLSSSILSKNIKNKVYRTIILPVVLYRCGSWLLTLRDEHRLRVFENRVLRRIFVPKRDKVTKCGETYIMWSLMVCNSHQILFGC